MEQLLALGVFVWIMYHVMGYVFGILSSFTLSDNKKSQSNNQSINTIAKLGFKPIKVGIDRLTGEDGFMSTSDQRRILSTRNKGLLLDSKKQLKLSEELSYQNALIVASVGMGKTTKILLPMLYDMLSNNKNNSIVVLDPKNEIYNLSSGFAEENKFKVLTLSPLDIDNSISFNPFEFIEHTGELESVIRSLVQSAHSGSSNSNDVFWRESSIQILIILSRLLFSLPDKQYRNLPNLKYLLNEFNGGSNCVLDPLFTKYCSSEVIAEYHALKSYEDTVLLSVIATANMALSPITNNESLKKLLATNSFDFKELRSSKVVLYLNIPVHLADSYNFLVSNFINSMMQTSILNNLPNKEDNSITFLWDELGNYKINKLDNFINITRGYKVSMVCFLQSLEQFENLYGKSKSEIILNSLNTKIYFGGTSLNTTNMLSNMIGKRHQNIQGRATLLPIIDSSEIRRLKDDEVLVFISNNRPLKINVLPYWKTYRYKKASKLQPYISKQRLVVNNINYINLGAI